MATGIEYGMMLGPVAGLGIKVAVKGLTKLAAKKVAKKGASRGAKRVVKRQGGLNPVRRVGPIGLSQGAAKAALTNMRKGGGHVIRKLEGEVIPSTGSLTSRVAAFGKIATPILRSPLHSAAWRVGGNQGRVFLGKAGGRDLAIFVAKDGPHQGKVLTLFFPDAKQLGLMYGR